LETVEVYFRFFAGTLYVSKRSWSLLETFTSFPVVRQQFCQVHVVVAVYVNMYDGHTLESQLNQVKELTGGRIRKAIADRVSQVKGGILSEIHLFQQKMTSDNSGNK
jgi:hypothetical protein